MRVKSLISLLMAATALLFLDSCSRESPLKENVGLKNNHSRVFSSRVPFENPQAFIDSMANTPVDSANSTPDTLTVTVNDTVYLIGVLPRFVDKIYLFQWTMIEGKDTVEITGDNAKPFAWSYSKPGVYYPMFVAFDGNNATDTAGTGTKRTYINVIDTKPELSVPKDTLWTKHDGDITFPIFAADSFGAIKSVKVDLDASGKGKPKEWKYEEDKDSLYLTIKYDKDYIDSLGNQKIYIIVEDDDGNEAMDSVYLHYNRLPTLKIISPLDGSRHSNKERFYFYYESEDEDNPQDLRFFIYAQVSKNGKAPTKAFTSDDLIAKEITSKIFEPTTEDGRNVITLVDDPSTEITGRIYWDMYVTDGYDIVRMERIATSDSTSRPWNFYIGDLSSTQGTFYGVAKFEGRDDHAGIRIEFNNGSKIFDGFTDAKGNYTIKADYGSYEVRASSSIREYQYVFQKDLFIESGTTIKVDDLILKDTTSPVVTITDVDTFDVRKINLNIYARDLASRLASVTAKFEGDEKELTCTKTDEDAIYNCKLDLENLVDGKYAWEAIAKDNAGNITSVKDTIYIDATTIDLTVNGKKKQLIGESNKLTFEVTVGNALPAADSVTWTAEMKGKKIDKKTKLDENGKGSFELTYEDIDAFTEENTDYVMTATYASNGVNISTQVKFGKLSNKPTIYFTEPGDEISVTMNDAVEFKASAYPGNTSTKITVSWDCGENLASGFTCPTAQEYTSETTTITAKLGYKTLGDHKVTLNVVGDDGQKSSDAVTVKVISDKPVITATTDGSEYKINAKVNAKISGSDKYGTINEIRWGCSDGNIEMVKDDNSKVLTTPAKSISDYVITLDMPNIESSKYRCLITAIDDDGEEGRDTLTFNVLKDPPTVTLKTHADAVKINSQQKVSATAYDALGQITKYEIACGTDLKSLPDWIKMSKSDTTVTMPSEAVTYYCVVQVTDDDNNTARDTAAYTVLVGRPIVKASANYETVTIKDVVELNAHAVDSLGSIVMYEWGCGSSSTKSINFTYSSSTTPKTSMTMPSKEDNKYLCIIKVTDDDDNEVKDTVEIKVLLAPPTVKVENKSMTIREGFNIALNATASDINGVASDPGEIVKREWSCALPDRISSNWKTVSVYDTVWKAPAANANFICVARATDNDGNTATDTVTFKYTSETPQIWVSSNLIYLNEGDAFTLDAKVNTAWQGINWFSWECVDKETGKSMEKSVPEYDYEANGKSFAVGKDSSYSEQGKNMYCIVSAEEKSTREVLKDTTEVRIMKYYPTGKISAADTVYLWSGDNALPVESRFIHDKTWGGFCSKPGDLGAADKSLYSFSWNFSSVDDYFYEGPTDGTLDTTIAEVHTALIRPSEEGAMTIGLAFLDSTVEEGEAITPSFKLRHSADTVYRTIYFRKAWQNLAQDTVVETAQSNVPVAFALIGDKPATAYLSGKNTVKISTYNGSKWSKLGEFTTSDSVTAVQLASDGKDLYVGALTTGNDFIVKKSAGGTSALTTGNTIASVAAPKLTFSAEGKPIIAYINTAESNKGYLAYLNGSNWTKVSVFSTALREINAVATSDGRVILVGVGNTTSYTGYVAMLNSSYGSLLASTSMGNNYSTIGLAVDGGSVYMAYMNRDTDKYGAEFKKGSIKTNSISWGSATQIFEAYISYHLSIAVRNGIVYIASGDAIRANLSQVHVFRYEDNQWHYHGENQLPYFGKSFYDKNGYYLRGYAPELTLDDSGKLYLSMLGRASGAAANTKYNGPIIMKYAADNWKVTPATCEE